MKAKPASPGRPQNQHESMATETAMRQATGYSGRYSPMQSLISADAPLTGSQVRSVSQMPQAFAGSGTSGNNSRDAYARAMADAGSSQLSAAADKYRQDFQSKAEQARSQDMIGQRQVANTAYQTERERQQTTRQQDMRRQQTLDQIKQFKRITQADAAAQRRNSMIQGIIGTGLVAATAPILGPALAGGAAATGFASSGAYSGLFGSLLGSGMVGNSMRRGGVI
jgi:hypothetical protein